MADKKTKEKQETVQSDTQEYKELLQRLQAEFDNYKKRVAREQEEYLIMANASLIKELLVCLDSFEQARKHDDNDHIKALHNQLLSILKHTGLKEIPSEGKIFDPTLHEVLMSSTSKEKEGKILEVFQKGYFLGDKVLRHAKVNVSKHEDNVQHDTAGNTKSDA